MALKLRRVLAGVAVRAVGHSGKAPVDGLPARVPEGAVHQLPVGAFRHGAAAVGGEHPVDDGDGLRPGQPEDTDGGGDGRRGDGGNGIVHKLTSWGCLTSVYHAAALFSTTSSGVTF